MSGELLRKIGFAGRRRPRPQRIDPFSVGEPWRGFVQNAVSARGRFLHAIDSARPGPLRDSLRDMVPRLDNGVDQCWRIAQYADSLARARRDIESLQARHKVGAADRGERGIVDRMDQVIETTRGDLRLLDARMGESVTRAIELTAHAAEPSEAAASLNGVVSELEALQQALEETSGLDMSRPDSQ